MRDWDERMKGGAVREERSPLKEAMDCEFRRLEEKRSCVCAIEGVVGSWEFTLRKADQLPLFASAIFI